MKRTILIIDDDAAVARLVKVFLQDQGFQVRHAPSADAGFVILKHETVTAVLLDINLPGISGIQALEIIKKNPQMQSIPVIMLTSHVEESFKVNGLKTGADDYVVKPFSLRELAARIEALLRRTQRAGSVQAVLGSKDVSVDIDRHVVIAGDKQVNVTPMEYELLTRLIEGRGRVLTYRMLADECANHREITSGSLYQLVKNLRHKLGKSGKSIETVYGIGYRFAAA